jgi:signal peptidase I
MRDGERGYLQMRRCRRKVWLLLSLFLAAGLWFAWNAVTYATAVRVYFVPTKSMSPTLAPADRIIADTRPRIPPKRGEIWVFNMPSGSIGVKRVVGLPGESVEVAGGRVLVDGQPLTEPYLAGPITYTMPAVRLQAGEYFVLGDNRNGSNDSHLWGPLEVDRFIGPVRFRPWPPSRIGRLR